MEDEIFLFQGIFFHIILYMYISVPFVFSSLGIFLYLLILPAFHMYYFLPNLIYLFISSFLEISTLLPISCKAFFCVDFFFNVYLF